jgi:mannose/fructose/N-acetylgalactosamine-specific phosphotransferase system component IIB
MIGYRWVRVDDRLLHGQVALGWRHALDPAAFLIVDDATAGDPFASALFGGAVPEGLELAILDALQFLDPSFERPDPSGTVVLIRGLAELRRLCEGGFTPERVNLGGLHHRQGARRYMDYIYLTEQDVTDARWLLDRGISLFAQDLPSSPQHPVAELLDSGGLLA